MCTIRRSAWLMVILVGGVGAWAQNSPPGRESVRRPPRTHSAPSAARTSRPARTTPAGDAATKPTPAPQLSGGMRAYVELEIATAGGEPMGQVVIEVNMQRTPLTARNFMDYVEKGFYDGTIFHRVLRGYIVQAGGYTSPTEKKKEGLGEGVHNESRRGSAKNERGTVALARGEDPNSGRSQFFINMTNNEQLDYPQAGLYGYTVFGKVVEGMEVLEKIAELPTTVSPAAQRRFERWKAEGKTVSEAEKSLPLEPPVIAKARRLEPEEQERRFGRPARTSPVTRPIEREPRDESAEQTGDSDGGEPAAGSTPAEEPAAPPADPEETPEGEGNTTPVHEP